MGLRESQFRVDSGLAASPEEQPLCGVQERFRRTWLGGGAQSDEGYRVLFNGRAHIEFKDAAGRVFVGAEGLATPAAFAVYPADMRVGAPDGPSLQNDDRRAFVAGCVRKAARYLGIRLDEVDVL